MINYGTLYSFFSLYIILIIGYLFINYFIMREKKFNIKMPTTLAKLYNQNNKYKIIYWLSFGVFMLHLLTIDLYQIQGGTHIFPQVNIITYGNIYYLVSNFYHLPTMYIAFLLIIASFIYILYNNKKKNSILPSYIMLTFACITLSNWIDNAFQFDKEKTLDRLRGIANSYWSNYSFNDGITTFTWLFSTLMVFKIIDFFFDLHLKKITTLYHSTDNAQR